MTTDTNSTSKSKSLDSSASSSTSSSEAETDNSSCSNDSITFKDISFSDDRHKEVTRTNETNKALGGATASVALDPRLKMVYSTVMETLNRDLRPQIEKLANESAKYHTLRAVYHLPSITDIKKEIMKQDIEGVEVKMDVDTAQLLTMVNKATKRADNSSFRNSVGSSGKSRRTISKNVNQCLTSIPERKYSEEKERYLPNGNIKYMFLSQVQSYERSKDYRDIRDLDIKELEIILQRIDCGIFPDIGVVKRITQKFRSHCVFKESRIQYVLKDLDNKELKLRILEMLHKSAC